MQNFKISNDCVIEILMNIQKKKNLLKNCKNFADSSCKY